MIVTIFGASGHMGMPVLERFVHLKEIDTIKVLLEVDDKRNKAVKKLAKKYPKIEIYYGDVANKKDIEPPLRGSSYLFNFAGVIPPLSDKRPDLSYRCNELGIYNIVEYIETNPEIKLIDVTSVALYGNHTSKHPFQRVGDPLMPSAYDVYGVNKLRGEFKILESNIPYFVIVRQTAMIYLDMLKGNMDDGLMFHTTFNDPFEWVSAEDTATLFTNILLEDIKGRLNYDNFWKKIFNIGGGEHNRISGYETIEGGLRLIGGTTSKFYLPSDNVLRNFHGGFFYDGDELEKLFHYQNDIVSEYWLKIKAKYPYMGLAKFVPTKLIRKFAIERVYKDSNSPVYWYKHNDVPRLTAFFGSKEIYEALPKKWEEFKRVDYIDVRDKSTYKAIDYGFNINKKDKDITYSDLVNVAAKHGGKLLSKEFKTGDVYNKVEWQNSDGEKFFARPYTVLRGGHWLNPLYSSYVWDFDRLAKKDSIYASYWYDNHEKDENHCYYMNEKFEALMK